MRPPTVRESVVPSKSLTASLGDTLTDDAQRYGEGHATVTVSLSITVSLLSDAYQGDLYIPKTYLACEQGCLFQNRGAFENREMP